MNLQQTKLNKEEWQSIEIPVPNKEKEILQLILKGFHDVNLKENKTMTLFNTLKMDNCNIVEKYVYCKHLQDKVIKIHKKYNLKYEAIDLETIPLKSGDKIRISNSETLVKDNSKDIIEFVLLDLYSKMCRLKYKQDLRWQSYFYTIKKITTYHIKINKFLMANLILNLDFEIDLKKLLEFGYETFEMNEHLHKYCDLELYKHQKELFQIISNDSDSDKSFVPKLIQYVAPTGTGKTLSPLGLSEKKRVIFLCAARHIGLALAKSAISCQKKIAFAFDCDDLGDVRLHYFAAKEFSKNKRSGGVGKVDNLVGDNVEIMICDMKSYIVAMNYMIQFNKIDDIILYWDEPTISLDQENPTSLLIKETHKYIHTNWKNNVIPTIVLSSATLPHVSDLSKVIYDFKHKFVNSEVCLISTHDCVKSIPLINKEGFVMLPHNLCDDYDEMRNVAKYFYKMKILTRYIDMREMISFILLCLEESKDEAERFADKFKDVASLNQESMKEFYLTILLRIEKEEWERIYKKMIKNQKRRYKSTIHMTTTDAHTLTDGPAIFLAKDVDKIARFCLQDANIPVNVIENIGLSIQYNSGIQERIRSLEKNITELTSDDKDFDPAVKHLVDKVNELKTQMRSVLMPALFVPNTKEHLTKYYGGDINAKPFTSDLSEDIIEKIILMTNIDNAWKILLLMGIGVFTSKTTREYTEIMKELAEKQKLYLIIASDDYIYGTNYQFCHGYICKDLNEMTQEKCIQAIGRVGRNKLQQDYSIRFRDNELLYKLVTEEKNKIEANNMCKLFQST
jgi:hypothetical protein